MKRILKIIALAIWAIIALSCQQNDDIEFVANTVAEPQIISSGDFGTRAAISYDIEIAASGTGFEAPVAGGSTTDTFFTWTVKEFNDAAIAAGLKADEERGLDIRVIASIGSQGTERAISNVSTFTVTPFTNAAPELFLVGAFQTYYGRSAWTPTEAFEMKYIGDGSTQVFDAYIKLGTDDGFKFISAAADWAVLEGNYGTDGGAQNGMLINSGSSGDIKPGVEGLYYVQVDIDALTYQIVRMDWGIIGNATPLGWDGETAMTYDFEANSFKITETLVDGEMKLRSKNTSNEIFGSGEDWKFNVGDSGEEAVAEDVGDSNFVISAGDYDVELAIEILGGATASVTRK